MEMIKGYVLTEKERLQNNVSYLSQNTTVHSLCNSYKLCMFYLILTDDWNHI